MYFMDVRQRLINYERRIEEKRLVEIWPVIRISIERIVMRDSLATGVSGYKNEYFKNVSLAKFNQLFGANLVLQHGTIGSSFIFALPDRLANRSIDGWNIYFGWLFEGLKDTPYSYYKIGKAQTFRSLLRICASDFTTITAAFFKAISIYRVIFNTVSSVTDKNYVSALIATMKIVMRVWVFNILTDRFSNQLSHMKVEVLIATACKDIAMMALVSSAKKVKAEVVEVQHGLFYEGDYGYTAWNQFSNSSCLPSAYIAWNLKDANFVSKTFAIARDKVTEFGLLTMLPTERKALEQKVNKESHSDVCLLILATGHFISPPEMANIVIPSAKLKGKLEIRVHPDGQNLQYLSDFIGELPSELIQSVEIIDSRKILPHTHIARSSCVIGELTTMVLEAAHLGVPSALVGPAAEKKVSYSAIPDRLMVASDPDIIVNFFKRNQSDRSKILFPHEEHVSNFLHSLIQGK